MPSSWAAGQTAVTYNVDVYADPTITNNLNGLPEFWWSNAVGAPGYLTETGFQVYAESVAADTWSFHKAGSPTPVATVPVGQWYEMETQYYWGVDGTLDETVSLWNADHTVLLGTSTNTTPFLDPVNQAFTPYYMWFTYFDLNMDVLFVDGMSVSSVPEPAGAAAVLAVVTAGAMGRRRRGR